VVAAPTTSGFRTARFLAGGTALRILLTPVVMGLVLQGGEVHDTSAIVAAVLFFLAAATDYLDGYLARRWQVTTKFGSFLDTMADKLLVTGVLLALVAVDRASPWIAALIVGREILILGLRGVVAADGIVMKPSSLARVKTAVQFLAILLAILRPGDPIGGLYLDQWAMLGAAVITVVSAVDYLKRFAASLSISDGEPT
jgi:CDP-diacylglycerol--glycerol-3-phosphate 3-phosphatidyltransferase